MAEKEEREAVIKELNTWIGTPYNPNQMVKGRQGGVDCAMLLVGVYGNVGLLPEGFDPRPYPTQWHLHQREERYLNIVVQFAHEVPAPTGPGDIAMFKIGRTYAHGGIITTWPRMVHAFSGWLVTEFDVSKNTTGKYALARLPQRFFSMWGESKIINRVSEPLRVMGCA